MNPIDPDMDRKRQLFNMTIISFVAQAGCVTILVIGVFLGLGLWLDANFGNKHWFTLGLLVVSVPISLLTMLYIARLAISKIRAESRTSKENSSEEAGIGKTS